MIDIKKFRVIIWWSLAILLLTSLLLLAFFIYNFSSHSISSNISDWSSFGSFLAPIIGILNTIILGLITILISSIQQKKTKFDRRDRIYKEFIDNNHEFTKLLVKKDVSELTKKEVDLKTIKITQFINAYSNELFDLGVGKEGKELILSINDSIESLQQFKDEEIEAEEARQSFFSLIEEIVDFETTFRRKMLEERYA